MPGVFKEYPAGMSDVEKDAVKAFLEGNNGDNGTMVYDEIVCAVERNDDCRKLLMELAPEVESFFKKNGRKLGISLKDIYVPNVVMGLAEVDTYVISLHDAQGKKLYDYCMLDTYDRSDVKELVRASGIGDIPDDILRKCCDEDEVTFKVDGDEYTFKSTYRNIGMEMINRDRSEIISWMARDEQEEDSSGPSAR